ncbi:sulfotransferase domain-containing protein [Phenylobacterium sp. J367]|uniref:sulfotransferase domain-containing protein n=1 Tax=Phenylobacterium sp. J367 TaxID=2898435 RepID=UPI002150D78F|nr:sulfotransferase domain-containing protein [Phenylobacterium sp. J367]MCR5878417.1 sulfotransferase domain-containing protein [Phenylobacterium sp. J367]
MPEADAFRPRKTRELMNHHMDSTAWDGFPFRDDVVVGTYAKSGTTWTQQIVGQLLFAGDPDVRIADISPWWDMRIIPPEVREMVIAQPHRRVLKTHLPADALSLSTQARYLYVARDGRDVMMSMWNHHANFLPIAYELINGTPGLVGDPLPPCDPDPRSYFRTWLDNDGAPFWSFWENIETWWNVRHLPNVKLVHFEDLKRDLEGEMRAIADFLEVSLPADRWAAAVEHCTFDWMKANAEKVAPLGGQVWEGGAGTFMNKGVNGPWRDVLTVRDSLDYEKMALERLGPECARWLATGEMAPAKRAA